MDSESVARFFNAILKKDSRILETQTWESLLSLPDSSTLFSGLISFTDNFLGRKELAYLGNLGNSNIVLDIFP